MSKGVVTVSNIDARDGEDVLEGDVRVLLREGGVELDIYSSLDPVGLSRIIHPMVEKIVNTFSFKGQHWFKAKGLFDLDGYDDHQLRGQVYLEKAGCWRH